MFCNLYNLLNKNINSNSFAAVLFLTCLLYLLVGIINHKIIRGDIRKKFIGLLLAGTFFITNVYAKDYIFFEIYTENGIVYDRKTKLPLTGIVDNVDFKDGFSRIKVPYVNGTKEGVAKFYYESGNLEGEVIFKNNVAVSGYMYNQYGIKTKMTKAHLYNKINKYLSE